MPAKNTQFLITLDMVLSLENLVKGCPYMLMSRAHVFGFTHNAVVVLSQFRCVHPENLTKIFDFNIL